MVLKWQEVNYTSTEGVLLLASHLFGFYCPCFPLCTLHSRKKIRRQKIILICNSNAVHIRANMNKCFLHSPLGAQKEKVILP